MQRPLFRRLETTGLAVFLSLSAGSVAALAQTAKTLPEPAALETQDTSEQSGDMAPQAPAAAPVDPLKKTIEVESLLEREDFFAAEKLLAGLSSQEIKQSPRLLVAKAMVAKGLYRTEEAFSLIKEALRKDQHYGPALFECALILMERKEWADAEILLRVSAVEESLNPPRRLMLPYYLGVVSFESGRLFDSRSRFLQLNWNASLDPALQQSSFAFMQRIAKMRPWNLISPITYQYETNMLALPNGTSAPDGYPGLAGSKLIAGLFANFEGLGGKKPAEGPYGVGLRLLGIQAYPAQFNAFNTLFVEAEVNWARIINKTIGVLKLASTLNYIRAGAKPVSDSVNFKANLLEGELTAGFENDLQKTAESNRSAFVIRGFREFSFWTLNSWSATAPVDLGVREPLDKENPGERRQDLTVTPAISFAPSRRITLKVGQKIGIERVSSAKVSTAWTGKEGQTINVSYTLFPFLILSGTATYDVDLTFAASSKTTQKGLLSLSVLGLL